MMASQTALAMNMETRKPDLEYKLLQRFSAEHVAIQFNGTLQNQAVVWHAHIHSLRDYCLQQTAHTQPYAAQKSICIDAQPFIDINIHNNTHALLVALNLPVIDDAAILRTIIMIRQYKRLKPGRHLYGDIATFHFDNS
jgi:hypothetical protein